jgi:hypothetical protein
MSVLVGRGRHRHVVHRNLLRRPDLTLGATTTTTTTTTAMEKYLWSRALPRVAGDATLDRRRPPATTTKTRSLRSSLSGVLLQPRTVAKTLSGRAPHLHRRIPQPVV